MKILYFFQELGTPMFQWQRVHIIDELEHHNCSVTTFNPLEYATPEEANKALINHLKQHYYDLFFTNVGYYKVLFPETVERIKKMGIPTLCLRCDNLTIPFYDKVLAPHFDLVWLTAKETERLYKKWRVNYFFAPYAANPYTYTYNRAQSLKRSTCFIGTPHGSRAIMINTLTEGRLFVDLYSGGNKKTHNNLHSQELKSEIISPSAREIIIKRFSFSEGRKLLKGSIINRIKGSTKLINNHYLIKHDGLPHEEMIETYSSTALALAFTSAGHTDVLNPPLPIINLRNFEIPMCGGIELCKYNEELAGYFEEGKEIVFYQDNVELVDKARYYTQKATDAELNAMKEAARKRAEEEHTWWNRFTKAFDLLGLKY